MSSLRWPRSVLCSAVLALAFTLVSAAAAAPEDTPTSDAPATEIPISENARRHFRAGVALLKDPDGERYEEAYLEFKAAYADSPSPKILGNMGLCAMKLERLGEAIDAYQKYVAQVADIDPLERRQIDQDLSVMTTTVVTVIVRTNVTGSTLTDKRTPARGLPITNTYPVDRETTLRIRPGRHELSIRYPGHEDATFVFDAQPGSSVAYDFVLKKSAPKRAERSFVPYALIGGGLALGAAGAITGVIASDKASAIRRACPDELCPLDYDLAGRRSTANAFAITTDILVGSAIIAVGVGAGWFIFGRGSSSPATGSASRGFCRADGCGVTF